MAVGAQCHVGCYSCSHTGNLLRVAKCPTGRKCRSGRVCEKINEESPPLTCFFSGRGRDSWSLVRRGSQPYCRNRQKSHALHSRSAGNYVPVPTYFRGSSAFQRSVPCQHVHSFRVPIVTIPDIHFYNLIIFRPWE